MLLLALFFALDVVRLLTRRLTIGLLRWPVAPAPDAVVDVVDFLLRQQQNCLPLHVLLSMHAHEHTDRVS